MLKCGSCGGGHIAGSRECEQYKHVMRVQQYREMNKGTTYAEALKKVTKCGEAEEGEGSPPVTCVTEDSMVVNKFNFLTFILEVLCDIKQTTNNSDMVRSVVKTAERIFGIEGVEPSTLYRNVFSREGKVKTSGCRTEEDDGTR